MRTAELRKIIRNPQQRWTRRMLYRKRIHIRSDTVPLCFYRLMYQRLFLYWRVAPLQNNRLDTLPRKNLHMRRRTDNPGNRFRPLQISYLLPQTHTFRMQNLKAVLTKHIFDISLPQTKRPSTKLCARKIYLFWWLRRYLVRRIPKRMQKLFIKRMIDYMTFTGNINFAKPCRLADKMNLFPGNPQQIHKFPKLGNNLLPLGVQKNNVQIFFFIFN